MAWKDVTSSEAVLSAIRECDRLGRGPFLKKYGFGPAKEYYIEHKGRFYDSKAIWGVAHGYQFPKKGALRWRDLNGGKRTVAPLLEAIGFKIVRRQLIPV